MAINPKTSGVHHIALRCTDMEKTKFFYEKVLGFTLALDTPDIIGFIAGPVISRFQKSKCGAWQRCIYSI